MIEPVTPPAIAPVIARRLVEPLSASSTACTPDGLPALRVGFSSRTRLTRAQPARMSMMMMRRKASTTYELRALHRAVFCISDLIGGATDGGAKVRPPVQVGSAVVCHGTCYSARVPELRHR